MSRLRSVRRVTSGGEGWMSDEELYRAKRAARLCYTKFVSKLEVDSQCWQFDFDRSDCEQIMAKCFEPEFLHEMKYFFMEKGLCFIKKFHLTRHQSLLQAILWSFITLIFILMIKKT